MPKRNEDEENDEFWGRSRKTRRADKRSRKRKGEDTGGHPLTDSNAVPADPSVPDPTAALPQVAPAPPEPRAAPHPTTGQQPILPPDLPPAPLSPPYGEAPAVAPREPMSRRGEPAPRRRSGPAGRALPTPDPDTTSPHLGPIEDPPDAYGQSPRRPTTSPRLASRRATTGAAGVATSGRGDPLAPAPASTPPRPRPRRNTGENALDARLDGLASRSRSDLAPAPDPDPAPMEPTTQIPTQQPPGARRPSRISSPSSGQTEALDLGAPAHRPMDESFGNDRLPAGSGGPFSNDSYGDEYDDGDEPTRRSGCGPTAIAMLVVAVVLLIALAAGALWVKGKISGGEAGEPVKIEVIEGQSTSDIGQELENKGVISDATVWTWYVRFKGGGDIQAGSYELHENMAMGDALEVLTTEPQTAEINVTIAEGLTINQTVERLTTGERAVEGFDTARLSAALTDGSIRSTTFPDKSNLEGLIFPDTYTLADDATENTLVTKMVQQMDKVLQDVKLVEGATAIQRDPYEIMIIASMIEKETAVTEERAQVARVIYNRLSQNMALQIDATSCYSKGGSPCQLSQADLDGEDPFNTRRRPAYLPPTPISSPSRASIEAALNPAQGDWLYYVLDPQVNEDGKHHLFTASPDEFQAAKGRCRDAGLGCG